MLVVNVFVEEVKMKNLVMLVLCLCVAGAVNADTVFVGTGGVVPGNLLDAGNWSNGLPAAGNDGSVNVSGFYTGLNNPDFPFGTATVTFGGGAVLSLANDTALKGGTWIVNNATLNCTDDLFAEGNLILNAGSVTTATDDWEANNVGGRITVNGGTHSSGTGTGHNVGAQSKAGIGIDFLGGTVTAGNFRFQSSSVSSVGGSAVLASAGAGTTFSDDTGIIDFLSGWTGSWTVGSFGVGEWATRLIDTANGFRLDGAVIDAGTFAANFAVSGDGTTLTMVPEPATMVLLGLGSLLGLRRKK